MKGCKIKVEKMNRIHSGEEYVEEEEMIGMGFIPFSWTWGKDVVARKVEKINVPDLRGEDPRIIHLRERSGRNLLSTTVENLTNNS